MILNDSQKFWNLFGTILGDSWQYFVIHKITLKFIWSDCWWFSMILSDSQWFTKNSEIYLGWFSAILYDSWWFPKITLKFIWVILHKSQWLSKNSEIYLGWISVIFNDIRWFTKNFDIYLGWFSVILIYLSVIHENSEI